MAEKEELLKEVVGIITQELTRDAVRKNRKKELVYTCNLAQNMSGWIGLSVTKDRSDGRVGVSPIVGVRSEEIEALVEKHWDRPAPTISISLGYLMPEQRHLEWLFESEPFDYVSEAKKVTKAIETYGIPFMKANASLDVIVDDLEHFASHLRSPLNTGYQLPAFW